MIKSMDEVTPRDKVQFGIAIGLMVFGCIVLLFGLIVPPAGQIHQSVLIAFGEIATLAAGVLGIDAIYTNKLQKIVAELKSNETKGNENKEQKYG